MFFKRQAPRRSASAYAWRAGRVLAFTAAGTAIGGVAACAAVHYRWQRLKEAPAYIDIVRDGFAATNYIAHSFVAGQVRDSLRRRREASEEGFVLWLAHTLREELEEAQRRDNLLHREASGAVIISDAEEEMPFMALEESRFTLREQLSTVADMKRHRSPSSSPSAEEDRFHVANSHPDDYLVQHVLARVPASVRATLMAAIDGVLAVALPMTADATVAHCAGRLDTPEYLVPYYLRSSLARFTYYATKKEGGSRFKRMDEAEFLQALLGRDRGTAASASAGAVAGDLFGQFDTNADGEISFKEFAFMLTLLATPRARFVSAFQMFNESDSQQQHRTNADPMVATLSFSEFCQFMETEGDEHSRPRIRNALMQRLFGPTGAKRCSAGALLKEVDHFKEKVWRAEFLQHASDADAAADESNGTTADADEGTTASQSLSSQTPTVTTEAIGQLVYGSLVGRHLPFALVANLRRLKAYDDSEGAERVPLESWLTLSRLMENVDGVGAAVRLYSHTTGRELGKAQFARAVRCAGDDRLAALSPKELDLVFALFDADGSGTISFGEFEQLARARRSFHVRSRIEEKGDGREFFLPRLLKCTSDAVLSE